jgi:hypothetical protein
VIRLGLVLGLVVAFAGCYRNKPAPRMTPIEHPVAQQPAQAAPPQLYTLEEALGDALSGPLDWVGTGEWFGMFHIYSCVYRNQRVFVVNIYCTKTKEKRAFGMVVLSPTRGRAYIYAEAEKPISEVRRAEYITLKVDGEPVHIDDKLAKLELSYTWAQLRQWDEIRYYKYVPGCFAGFENKRPQNGCMQQLDALEQSWPESNRAFIANPTPAWYALIADFRARAKRDGRDWTK